MLKFYFNPMECDEDELREVISLAQAELSARIERSRIAMLEMAKYWFENQDEYELRHEHQTTSTNHREWQSDNGEPWKFLVVKKTCPVIYRAEESSRGCSFVITKEHKKDENGYLDKSNWLDKSFVKGHGETKEEAILDAYTELTQHNERKDNVYN